MIIIILLLMTLAATFKVFEILIPVSSKIFWTINSLRMVVTTELIETH